VYCTVLTIILHIQYRIFYPSNIQYQETSVACWVKQNNFAHLWMEVAQMKVLTSWMLVCPTDIWAVAWIQDILEPVCKKGRDRGRGRGRLKQG
jgi:hypothetical protein